MEYQIRYQHRGRDFESSNDVFSISTCVRCGGSNSGISYGSRKEVMEKLNVYDYYITPEEYETAKENGISSKLLEQRVRLLAWSKEKAVSTPPHKKKPIKAWVEIAEKNGICYSTLRYRMNRLGWDPERAATQPLQDKATQAKKACEKSRKYPEQYLRLAEKNGIKERTFHRRMKEGWDPLRASTRPAMTASEIGLMTKDKRKREFRRFFKPLKEVRSIEGSGESNGTRSSLETSRTRAGNCG